jgi:hypothetical protein
MRRAVKENGETDARHSTTDDRRRNAHFVSGKVKACAGVPISNASKTIGRQANGQPSLLAKDEARRIASNVGHLP